MNKDIRISVAFKDHRKRKRLTRILGFGSEIYLIDLWLTAAVDRPTGHLTGWDEEDIADACGWMGKPSDLVDGLIESLWLEKDADGEYSIHDWCEHQAWACRVEDRADSARFSRLSQVNKDKYLELKEKGVTAISKIEYEELAKPRRIPGEPPANSQQDASGVSAEGLRAPGSFSLPSPSPAHNEEEPLPDESGEQHNIFDKPKSPKDEFKGACPAANKNIKLYHPKFCDFWDEYPVRPNGSKGSKWNAFKEWWRVVSQKLLTPDELIVHIKRLKFSYNGYPKDAERWLKSAMWHDVPEKPSTPTNQPQLQPWEDPSHPEYWKGR